MLDLILLILNKHLSSQHTSVGEGVRKLEPFGTVGREVKRHGHCRKQVETTKEEKIKKFKTQNPCIGLPPDLPVHS